jgi:HEAT repeat protein
MNVTHIAQQLFSDDVSTRLAALATLATQDEQQPLSPEICRGLLSCLGHSRKNVQRGAAAQLARFARTQPEIVQALCNTLTDPDPRVRWTAAFSLSQIDLPTPVPLPVLIENLGHEESDLRWAAATAVLRLATQHPSVSAELIRLARTGNAVQRRMALYCLRDLEQTEADAIAAYRASLHDPDPMVRLGGLSCLGKLKVAADEVLETLLGMLEADPDFGVRRATAVTLGQLGSSTAQVVAALTRAAHSGDVGLRKAAIGALAKLQ